MCPSQKWILLAAAVAWELALNGCANESINNRIASLRERTAAIEARISKAEQSAQAGQQANQRLDELSSRVDAIEQRLASKKPRDGPEPLATRLFVPPSFKPPASLQAFGMLVFAGRPSAPDAVDRYLRICTAYLNTFDDAVEVWNADPDAVQMLTAWPRTDLEAPLSFDAVHDDADGECRRAVAHYSFVTAHLWMSRMKAGPAAKRGPYLVAVARDGRGKGAPLTILKLDLSRMETESQIENAFHLWMAEIEKNPRSWNSAWRPQVWKLYVASMLNQYGKQVFDAITIVRHAATSG